MEQKKYYYVMLTNGSIIRSETPFTHTSMSDSTIVPVNAQLVHYAIHDKHILYVKDIENFTTKSQHIGARWEETVMENKLEEDESPTADELSLDKWRPR